MVGVRLVDLTKRFGRVVAVERVNLEVRDGEFMVLLGPSGCGKTTTLRCIAGLEIPDEGRVFFGDEDVTYLPPKDRNVSMVFQSYAVWPHMSVYDNIAFPLKVKKCPESEIRERVKWAAELLKIEELLDRYPHQLSGGQRQRVAVARAIVIEPRVLLMDEPLSNLDALLRVVMRSELKKLQRRIKVTTIYVTHDQVEAMTMADRIAVMNAGTLQQYGTPDEIYYKPANKFVASFIGSPPMNFLEVSLVERGGKLYLDAGALSLELPDEIAGVVRERAKNAELILGFRPEDCVVDFEPAPNSIPGELYVVEPLGSEVILDVKVGDSLVKVKTTSLEEALGVGRRVWIRVPPDRMYLFDRKTEESVL